MPAVAGTNMEGGSEGIRALIHELIDKRALASAITMAHSLVSASAAFENYLVLCHCLFLNGDYRRCISILEKCGVPLNESLDKAAATIDQLLGNAVLTPVAKDELDLLSGVLQLLQCLSRCEDHRECQQILTKLLSRHELGDAHTVYFVDSRSDSVRHVQSILSQLFCLSGSCCEQLEQKRRAVSCFQRALAVDHRCAEAFTYLVKAPNLSLDEKEGILQSCLQRCSADERRYLSAHYSQTLAGQHLRTGAPLDSLGTAYQPAAMLETIEAAESLYHRGRYAQAYMLSKALLAADPLNPLCATLCLSCMLLLNRTADLFSLAHELMAVQPKQALSIYAVGCYYYAIGSNRSNARARDLCLTYLRKACKRDKRFAHAHVLLGHALSALEESDQALAAYRAASRLLPEDGSIWISMAQELIRVNNCSLAVHSLLQAQQLCPWNATVFNEMGVACARLQRSEEAMQHLHKAVQITLRDEEEAVAQRNLDPVAMAMDPSYLFRSVIFFNFGTALRQAGEYEEAVIWFERSLSMNPSDGMTLAALGFTLHLMRRFDEAVVAYHKSLALQPKLNFAADLLNAALDDVLFYTPTS